MRCVQALCASRDVSRLRHNGASVATDYLFTKCTHIFKGKILKWKQNRTCVTEVTSRRWIKTYIAHKVVTKLEESKKMINYLKLLACARKSLIKYINII